MLPLFAIAVIAIYRLNPYPEDILLVIEVSDSTLKYDRVTKLGLYAEDGILEYWIFNLVAQHVEAYSQPYQEQNRQFNYRFKRVYLPNESILLPSFPDIFLDLSIVFCQEII